MATRSVRADAFSSFSRIIGAAQAVFASGDGSGTLDRIAKEAGVGIATLYRHFPNRQALARAVYDRIYTAEVEPLFAAFDDGNAPRPVLLDLLERLADIAERERGLASSLGNLTEVTTELLTRNGDVFTRVVAKAQAAGTLRPDIVAADVPNILALMVAGLGVLGNDRAARRRYLSLLLDALNPAAATPLPGSTVDIDAHAADRTHWALSGLAGRGRHV